MKLVLAAAALCLLAPSACSSKSGGGGDANAPSDANAPNDANAPSDASAEQPGAQDVTDMDSQGTTDRALPEPAADRGEDMGGGEPLDVPVESAGAEPQDSPGEIPGADGGPVPRLPGAAVYCGDPTSECAAPLVCCQRMADGSYELDCIADSVCGSDPVYECDGPEDCPSGARCCLEALSSDCTTGACSGDFFCKQDRDCPSERPKCCNGFCGASC